MTEVCHDAGFEVINKDPMYVLLNDEDVLDNTNVFEDEPDLADDVLIDVAVDAILHIAVSSILLVTTIPSCVKQHLNSVAPPDPILQTLSV